MVQERCETDPIFAATSEDLFRNWSAYAEAHGEHPQTLKSLSQTLKGLGYQSVSETLGTARNAVSSASFRISPP
jgi:hypothetical protein